MNNPDTVSIVYRFTRECDRSIVAQISRAFANIHRPNPHKTIRRGILKHLLQDWCHDRNHHISDAMISWLAQRLPECCSDSALRAYNSIRTDILIQYIHPQRLYHIMCTSDRKYNDIVSIIGPQCDLAIIRSYFDLSMLDMIKFNNLIRMRGYIALISLIRYIILPRIWLFIKSIFLLTCILMIQVGILAYYTGVHPISGQWHFDVISPWWLGLYFCLCGMGDGLFVGCVLVDKWQRRMLMLRDLTMM